MLTHTVEPSPASASLQATSDAKEPNTVITKKDRRYQLVKLFIIALVSTGTVALTIIDVVHTANSFEKKTKLIYKVQGSINTAFLIHNLQKERGLTALQLGFQLLNFNESRLKLRDTRRETTKSIAVLESRDDTDLNSITEGTSTFYDELEEFRNKIDKGKINVITHLHKYRHWVYSLISTLTDYIKTENLEDYANTVYAYEMVVLGKEEAGMERALGGLKFIYGKNFSIINTTWYNEKRALAQNYLKTAFLFSPEVKKTYSMLLIKNNNSQVMNEIEKHRFTLSGAIYNKHSDNAAYRWFELMTKYNNMMLELQIRQADLIEEKVKEELYLSTNQLLIRSLLLCFTLIVVPCIVLSLAKVQKSFYEYTLSLFDKVQLEQARTDFIMRENARHVESKSNFPQQFPLHCNVTACAGILEFLLDCS
jgi:hypothetical protein